MNSKLLHRISAIENEMDGEFDLRHVATTTLAECARSGQMDSRQIAAHVATGELRLTESDIGFECALPIKEPAINYVGREPISGEAKVLIAALALAWGLIAALSYSDDLVALWPWAVAALNP